MRQLEPASIYLTSFARDPATHRWAIFVPYSVSNGSGRLFRVVESPTRPSRSPKPQFEVKDCDILSDQRLFLLLKLGNMGELTLDGLAGILSGVTIPHPDDEYSHLFDGRTWAIKAIMRLSAYAIIQSRRLELMEQQIIDIAAQALHSHMAHGGWTLAKL